MNNKFLPNEILNIIFSYCQPNPICKELKFYIEIRYSKDKWLIREDSIKGIGSSKKIMTGIYEAAGT